MFQVIQEENLAEKADHLGNILREELNKLIRDKGFWDELSDLDTFKLTRLIKENNLPKELEKDIEKFIKKTESYRLSLGKK